MIVINTPILQNQLSRAFKGASQNKILPFTGYVRLALEEDVFTITCTSGDTYIQTYISAFETGEKKKSSKKKKKEVVEFFAVVQAEPFMKLISRTSSHDVTLQVVENTLIVKGNGSYKFPLFTGEFPMYEMELEDNKYLNCIDIDIPRLKHCFEINEYALAKDMVMPCLTAHYIGEIACSTDGIKMSVVYPKTGREIFENDSFLFSKSFAELISLIEDIKPIPMYYQDNKILFVGSDIVVFGCEMSDKINYPDITPIVELECPCKVEVQVNLMTEAVSRLELFVDPLDNYGLDITADKDSQCFIFADSAGNSSEVIPFEGNIDDDYVFKVSLNLFSDLLDGAPSEKCSFHFGHDDIIQLSYFGKGPDRDQDYLHVLGLLQPEGE